MQLSSEVLRFISRVRRNPAAAVDPAELEMLERSAARSIDPASLSGDISPVAGFTWMSRKVLPVADDSTSPDEIALGEPVRIVAVMPIVTGLTSNVSQLDWVDVEIAFRRGKDVKTARASRELAQGERTTLVSLAHLSTGVSGSIEAGNVGRPRIVNWEIEGADPNMTITYHWALDAAARAAVTAGDIQISLGLFIRPLEEG